MFKKLKKSNGGFTIIEVMIVLAIAALILLIVLLAVPALQRNARNTQRKNDASSLVSAVSEYVNNAGGQLPTSAGNFTANWKPGFYTIANVNFKPNAAATVAPDPGSTDKINVYTFSGCNAAGTASISSSPTPSSRSIAMTYDVETQSGMQEQCVTAQ